MLKFQIGDRVKRLTDVFDSKSKMLHGTVMDIISWPKPEVYIVEWDEVSAEKRFSRYFVHGIEPLPLTEERNS